MRNYLSIVAFLCIVFIFSHSDANPIVLTDADMEVLPKYLWVGSLVILLLEAFAVSTILASIGAKFWRAFLFLMIANLLLYAIFAKWIILVGRYDVQLPQSAFLAESAIVVIETFCIYIILRCAWFSKGCGKAHGIAMAFILSLCSNALSAFAGFLYSVWAYEYLYGLRLEF